MPRARRARDVESLRLIAVIHGNPMTLVDPFVTK
jgi:hypothetical protein